MTGRLDCTVGHHPVLPSARVRDDDLSAGLDLLLHGVCHTPSLRLAKGRVKESPAKSGRLLDYAPHLREDLPILAQSKEWQVPTSQASDPNGEAADFGAPDLALTPYVSFKTLMGLLDRIGQGATPPRIDKGFLDNYSGGTQAILLAALRSMDLINDDNSIKPQLDRVCRDEAARKSHVLAFLGHRYREQQALATQNGTSQQLEESFTRMGFKGADTRRKAIVFYLSAVDYAEAPKSPYFKPPRQGAMKKPRHRPGVGPTPPVAPIPLASDQPSASQGERITVDVGAGSVSLIVDVRWLDLDDETFVALRKLTSDLRSLDVAPLEEDDDS